MTYLVSLVSKRCCQAPFQSILGIPLYARAMSKPRVVCVGGVHEMSSVVRIDASDK